MNIKIDEKNVLQVYKVFHLREQIAIIFYDNSIRKFEYIYLNKGNDTILQFRSLQDAKEAILREFTEVNK